MRTALLVAALLCMPAAVQAQAPTIAPAYQRMRQGAGDWQARGGHSQSWRGNYGIGGYFNPYFFAPPIIAGSWYERPYPYHFDYYRYRWSGPPNGLYGDPGVEMMPVAECPCLTTPPPVEVIE